MCSPKSFNSRPHKEVDAYSFNSSIVVSFFQLTTSQGGRRNIAILKPHLFPFNSRPHKEVDWERIRCRLERIRFQLTTSQGGRLWLSLTWALYSSFQLTTSQGGRHVQKEINGSEQEVFQLTTSQGGRRLMRSRRISRLSSFNSRPHKEVDRRDIQELHRSGPFNSRPHKEVDQQPRQEADTLSSFQLTTSQGGRHCHVLTTLVIFSFQLTTSQGGRLLKSFLIAVL